MFRAIVEIVLIWWIISAAMKWWRKSGENKNFSSEYRENDHFPPSGFNNIEDADFEEIKKN